MHTSGISFSNIFWPKLKSDTLAFSERPYEMQYDHTTSIWKVFFFLPYLMSGISKVSEVLDRNSKAVWVGVLNTSHTPLSPSKDPKTTGGGGGLNSKGEMIGTFLPFPLISMHLKSLWHHHSTSFTSGWSCVWDEGVRVVSVWIPSRGRCPFEDHWPRW